MSITHRKETGSKKWERQGVLRKRARKMKSSRVKRNVTEALTQSEGGAFEKRMEDEVFGIDEI